MSLLRPVSLGFAGLLLVVSIAACSGGTNTATSSSSSPESPASPAATPEESPTTVASPSDGHGGDGHDHGKAQVIEIAPYHLGLATEKKGNNLVLTFDLQKGEAHTPVTGAKVQAQIQLPDGSKKTLDLTYDATGKHYTATLPGAATGDYQIAILTDIGGEKINGRFRANVE